MEEKEATRFLTKLAAPNTYEQSNIKTKLETGVLPVVERFEHALKIIAECPTCTENYKKKIVPSSSEMTETTRFNNSNEYQDRST
jgi:hypothetical protein